MYSYICTLTETMSRRFQGSRKSTFGGSEKDRYFLKIPKWQHKLALDYNQGKVPYYFVNNAPKTCLYGLKYSGILPFNDTKCSSILF